ncbi:hypothetical protein CANCADRAFT_19721, partial [Tortispora caseinolytica NRRL Y-17796]
STYEFEHSRFSVASLSDSLSLDQSNLLQHLGDNSNVLMPHSKTFELYKANAKRTNDPGVQYELALIMIKAAFAEKAPTDDSTSESATPNGKSRLSLLFPSSGKVSSVNSSPGRTPSSSSVALSSESSSQQQQGRRDPDKAIIKEAIGILKKLAERGHTDSQYLIADILSVGTIGKPDLVESFNLFLAASKHGHVESTYRVALCYEKGWGTAKDYRKCIQYLRQACSKNHPGAMFRYGAAAYHGRLGLSQAKKVRYDGIKWLMRASEVANEIFPAAPYELALIFLNGFEDLIIPDKNYALQLLTRSAELNHGPAAVRLGSAYERGDDDLNCPPDASLSIHYYTIGAMAGEPMAMMGLLSWYVSGAEGVLDRNEEQAYQWARRAAFAGDAKGQFAVGYFLEEGIGTDPDPAGAMEWYMKAAKNGDQRAKARIAD